jgi:hypothetical protein
MISTKTMLLMALLSALFAAGPLVAEHQSPFAAHQSPHKGSGDSLRGVGLKI